MSQVGAQDTLKRGTSWVGAQDTLRRTSRVGAQVQ